MSRITLLIISIVICQYSWSKPLKLSSNSKISVLTCDSGEELYSAFGHSALRVKDSINNIDLTFNYGTFDFDTPNFYLKFANGKLNYMLSASRFKYFLPSYFHENRTVTEQVLNLNIKDRQAIYDALILNYQPENRNYKYDFFFDNCATRIYDIINNNIEGGLILNNSANSELTFREHLHTYLINSPWVETGLNLLLGLPADDIASIEESTYLPNFLLLALEDATLVNGSKAVSEEIVLLDFSDTPKSPQLPITPAILFWLLLALGVVLSLLSIKYNFSLLWFDNMLFIISGFIGIFLSYMWFITDHQVPQNNLNVLWAVPFAVLIPFVSKRKPFGKLCIKYQLISLSIFVLGWYFLPQSFPQATLPFAILLLLRTGFIYKRCS
ncbi:DUF4105 domain-containing protein [Saccharicrinis aurantiacus]|uniref:lipoprotein N-acyltransferase Lnb domain-containing protein n=1 Tax=Saccharicrinis aurantiacus TaxID=1849719 RepID=UPI00249105C8|nr:DUF4105 domain-containing protein [Saccharicrinis aurantiacus]